MTVEQRSNKEPILTDGVNPRNQNQSHPGTAICVSTTLYVPLPGFGLLSDRRWMQSGCKMGSKLRARMQIPCKGAAIRMHSAGMDANTVQTGCEDEAVGLSFGSAPRTPSYLGGSIDGPGRPNPGRRRRSGEKGPTAATRLPATFGRSPPRRSDPSQCPPGTPTGTEVRADPLALAGDQ